MEMGLKTRLLSWLRLYSLKPDPKSANEVLLCGALAGEAHAVIARFASPHLSSCHRGFQMMR